MCWVDINKTDCSGDAGVPKPADCRLVSVQQLKEVAADNLLYQEVGQDGKDRCGAGTRISKFRTQGHEQPVEPISGRGVVPVDLQDGWNGQQQWAGLGTFDQEAAAKQLGSRALSTFGSRVSERR